MFSPGNSTLNNQLNFPYCNFVLLPVIQ
jgi:hypothetical protein